VVVSLKCIRLIVLEMLEGLAANFIHRTAYTTPPPHYILMVTVLVRSTDEVRNSETCRPAFILYLNCMK
jgi:hypothetical protein